MAHFRGVVTGGRGSASRLGHKTSGLSADADGWNIGARVWISYNADKDRDEVTITLNGGSNGAGSSKDLGTYYKENGEYIKI